MKNKFFFIFVLAALIAVLSAPSSHAAYRISLKKSGFLWDDIPFNTSWDGSITFKLYDGELASVPVASQTFPWGTWFGVLGGMTVLPVMNDQEATIKVEFTNTAALTKTPDLWMELFMNGSKIGIRDNVRHAVWSLFAKEAEKADDADTVDGVHAADLEESSEIISKIASHASNQSAHHVKTTTFSELTDFASDAQIPNNITVDHAATAGDADMVDGKHASEFSPVAHNHNMLYYSKAEVDGLMSALQAEVNVLKAKLAKVTVSADGANIYITGANLNIRSGSGTTDGVVNGKGNIIIGYNENIAVKEHTGSHNLIVGSENGYSSYGGAVLGLDNLITGAYASVTGGTVNVASGDYSSVSAGSNGFASGEVASISGGDDNVASGLWASISGGWENVAVGDDSSVSGGHLNSALGLDSSVSGGRNNVANGSRASISGGRYNKTLADYASITGGGGATPIDGNTAFANYGTITSGSKNFIGDVLYLTSPANADPTLAHHASITAGHDNRATKAYASVSGGHTNTASNLSSSVSGGINRLASGIDDWRAGSLFEDF